MKRKKFFLLLFLLCSLCVLFTINSNAVTIKIGDIDGFGFDELSSLVGADGKPVDRNNNGILDSGDVLPDLNRNGCVAVGNGDDFDNRTDEEIYDESGSKWTDVVLLKPTTIGPGPANNAEFIFNFDVPQVDASDYGKDHFFSFVYADYDANPMYAMIEGEKLNLLGNSDGGADGLIWRAYSLISWSDLLDGEVHIKIVAPAEPYVAFDYALLDLQPISVCDYADEDHDGVIDQWDKCPKTPVNSYVNKNGCSFSDNSALSGHIFKKGKPLTQGSATLIQSGEIFQKSLIDNYGYFKFSRVNEEKSINVMIRKPIKNNETWTNDFRMTFVLINPGTFVMGSPENEPDRSSDEVQHSVTLTHQFYMQTTEVTQGQWKKIMGKNPSTFSSCGNDCPVENVTWKDAQEFIEKLNLHENTNRYQLPTEAQWEYAARAGSTTSLANGNLAETLCIKDTNLNELGWYCGNSDSKSHQVAQKQANAWGLYDMHGNVWEWCQDWYGSYPTNSVTDPGGPSSGSSRVLRGGSWRYYAHNCRSAKRYKYNPGSTYSTVGLRLSRTIE